MSSMKLEDVGEIEEVYGKENCNPLLKEGFVLKKILSTTRTYGEYRETLPMYVLVKRRKDDGGGD